MAKTTASRRRVGPLLALLLTLGLTAGLSGCDAVERGFPLATFRPASAQTEAINNLAILLLVIATIAFVIVEGWLLLAAFRFRNRPEEEAVQTHGNLALETGWTVATAFVIFAILGLTVWVMWRSEFMLSRNPEAALPQAGAFPNDILVMRVVGHQFWWTFEYPREGIVTGNEIAVPVGRTVKVQLEADDVIHSFWVPRLNGKTDTIPGQINHTEFVAIQPGTYTGICGEYCGTQHAHMGFLVDALPVSDFSRWVRQQQAPAAEPVDDQQRAGQQVFQQACASCHAVRGTQARGVLGPDLTHFGSRKTIGANTMENTPENLARWIRNPQEVKPGNKMPNLNLDQARIDQLVAYLMNLK